MEFTIKLWSDALSVVIYLIAFKSIMIGSEFSFILWFKHGNKYLSWWDTRPKFKA